MKTERKVAIITGASQGIGEGLVRGYLARGYRVVANSRSIKPDAYEGDVLAVAGDIADPAVADRVVGGAVATFGRIDTLVNNAGVFEAVDDNASDEEWHSVWGRAMQINLQASADLCRLAIATWRGAGSGGRIVNVACRAAYRGDSPKHWHYAASKAGMVAMTKTIARGYAAENILAFAVCPGFTASDMVGDYLETRGGAKLLADIPLGRVATPDEIAEVIRWLASDAPPSTTGAVIDANGASYVR